MSNSTVRRFVFTLHNYTEDEFETCKRFVETNCKYGILGREVCPTTHRPHIQAFCSLEKPKRFSTIKRLINNRCHIEKANGTDLENQTYCRKSGDFFEKGQPQSQGQRSDLQSLVADIQAGEKSYRNIALRHPTCFIRYHRGIRTYLNLASPVEPRSWKTSVYYFFGPPGSGKSRRALAEATALTEGTIYYKPRGDWWDGYEQNDCVIIDDFYGWIKYDELLKITDRYPYKVPVKGGYEEFTTKHIWITSNVDTHLLYKFKNYSNAAFERRITLKELIE